MTVRRSAAALASTAVLLAFAAPAALADSSSPSPSASPTVPSDPHAGLYGTSDPTYDGVWRQSLAFLAQKIEYVTPSVEAVNWLKLQQCDSGAFASYRDFREPCDAKTMTDTNATAAAVQALAELTGEKAAVENGIDWLASVQNDDGGWGYSAGSPSDANSTAIVAGAFARAGKKLADVTSAAGHTPYDLLRGLALPCGDEDGGAFAYQPDKKGALAANADATAAAVLGTMGKGLAAGSSNAGKAPVCTTGTGLTTEQVAQNGAHWLTTALAASGHLDQAPMPGAETTDPQPDFGNTADAVVALAASGHRDKAASAVAWLEKNSGAWAKQSGPAAYAQLVLAAHATGTDARDFGGTDLVARLNATGPTPAATAVPSPTPTPASASAAATDDDSGVSVWWLVGIGLAFGAGIGFLLSNRRKDKGGR
ncbi:prenyltransferase/squalene oxidase repeat-containing protein [Streptomyces sp. NPDC060198]|uniref:prenyltransferase/squalene oxidase repeat-containing protein n=1 Tax=Streptomyces sp. NPDC060198 TaxID=3347070 RepID=UPI0036661E9D